MLLSSIVPWSRQEARGALGSLRVFLRDLPARGSLGTQEAAPRALRPAGTRWPLLINRFGGFTTREQRVCRPVRLFRAGLQPVYHSELPLPRSCPLYAEIKCGPKLSLLTDSLGTRGGIPRPCFYFSCFLFCV